MRGVAVDCTNYPPTARKIRNVGLDSIRIEMRDLPSFYEYTHKLPATTRQAWLVGPSTGPIEPILQKATVAPALIIIGNEPDQVGESSWTMSHGQYVQLYNKTALAILAKWPGMELSMAGMYDSGYAWRVRPYLIPTPRYLNLHYPSGIDQFRSFSQGTPCIVGEWCWRTASQQEMYDWVNHFLDVYAWHWFWFCWADYMVPNMGLVTAGGKITKAYRYLKEAL